LKELFMRNLTELELSFNRYPLDRCDRRILLGGSLRLLFWRFRTGRAILRADLVRLAVLADDWEQQENVADGA
jgi:hypothetical protein